MNAKALLASCTLLSPTQCCGGLPGLLTSGDPRPNWRGTKRTAALLLLPGCKRKEGKCLRIQLSPRTADMWVSVNTPSLNQCSSSMRLHGTQNAFELLHLSCALWSFCGYHTLLCATPCSDLTLSLLRLCPGNISNRLLSENSLSLHLLLGNPI